MTERSGWLHVLPIFPSSCTPFFLFLSSQVETDNANSKTPVCLFWPLICVQHATLNFNILTVMFVPFFTQCVDSAEQIKQYLCKRRIPSIEIHQPTSLNKAAVSPAPGRHQHEGASWQQLCSGRERSLIMNTKSACEKGYHFQTLHSLPCTSPIAFIIAFSLSFHCHLFCQWKYELWLCSGSVGGRKGDERKMVG